MEGSNIKRMKYDREDHIFIKHDWCYTIYCVSYLSAVYYALCISVFFPMNKICSGRYLCDYICSIQTK